MALRLLTWNVNSVRVRLEQLMRVMDALSPDVVCLQETKVPDADFPREELAGKGYRHTVIHGEKGYNGVAILSRRPFIETHRRFWCDKEDCRHASVKLEDGPEVHCFYVPSGGPTPDPVANDKFAHKLSFLEEMTTWAEEERVAERPLVIMGDFNVAPLENDVWNHKRLVRSIGHTPGETERMAALKRAGRFTDVGRHFVPPDEPLYTWWPYRHPQSFQKNYGWRLDHIWTTPPLESALSAHQAHIETRTWERPSDHVPVVLDLA